MNQLIIGLQNVLTKLTPNNKWLPYEAILFQADVDHPSELKGLLSESWNAAVLGSGASKTVCGRVWLDNYIGSLYEVQKANIVFQTSPSIYHFGDGKTFKATKKTQIPAEIGSHNVLIETDVINSDIPLLISRDHSIYETSWYEPEIQR